MVLPFCPLFFILMNCLYSLILSIFCKQYPTAPKATATFKDSFFPSIGRWITLSDLSRALLETPLTSFPIISAKGNFGLNWVYKTLSLVCSKETILTLSFFSVSIIRQICQWYSQATFFSAPNAVLEIFGWGGRPQIPVKKTLVTPKASAVLKIEPIFSKLRMLSAIR